MCTLTRTALITGSSSGIGYEVANELLQAGWNVVLNGRHEGRLKQAALRLGHADRVAQVAGSTSDRSTGEKMVNAARERFDTVDLLVNNAGEFGLTPFLEVSEADLEHYYSVNLKGTYLTSQAAVRAMIDGGRGGSIVNIGTVLVDHSISWVTGSAAVVTKGAIHALTLALASELAPHNIRVNAVAPGFIRTPLFKGADMSPLAATALLKRVGEVQDIAAAVRYLAEARFVTGHIVNVDGGYVTGRREAA
jgi:NAD(P)-dependent dehydrogenase (short-subunit alcohol dehydrogenase family)